MDAGRGSPVIVAWGTITIQEHLFAPGATEISHHELGGGVGTNLQGVTGLLFVDQDFVPPNHFIGFGVEMAFDAVSAITVFASIVIGNAQDFISLFDEFQFSWLAIDFATPNAGNGLGGAAKKKRRKKVLHFLLIF